MMQTITFRVDDSHLQKAVDNLKEFVKKNKTGNFSYVNELGEIIEVIDGKEYIIPSKTDTKAFKESKKEEYSDLSDLKSELCID